MHTNISYQVYSLLNLHAVSVYAECIFCLKKDVFGENIHFEYMVHELQWEDLPAKNV